MSMHYNTRAGAKDLTFFAAAAHVSNSERWSKPRRDLINRREHVFLKAESVWFYSGKRRRDLLTEYKAFFLNFEVGKQDEFYQCDGFKKAFKMALKKL